jgi:hypothetical protein
MCNIPRNAKEELPEHVARLQKQEEQAIRLERYHAEKLGVVEEFDKYVQEGRFRDYMPILNCKKLEQQKMLERRVCFILGAIIGFLGGLLARPFLFSN